MDKFDRTTVLTTLQLRIRIECAFGMLVNRWGLLCRALPSAINMNRTLLLTMCLCRLHNFCIDERLKHRESSRLTVRRLLRIEEPLAIDLAEIETHGGVPLQQKEGSDVPVPEQLLHAGHHHDDTEKEDRRRLERYARRRSKDGKLPRDILHNMVIAQNLKRPQPNKWKEKETQENFNP